LGEEYRSLIITCRSLQEVITSPFINITSRHSLIKGSVIT
jgi:hypothetical protein